MKNLTKINIILFILIYNLSNSQEIVKIKEKAKLIDESTVCSCITISYNKIGMNLNDGCNSLFVEIIPFQHNGDETFNNFIYNYAIKIKPKSGPEGVNPVILKCMSILENEEYIKLKRLLLKKYNNPW